MLIFGWRTAVLTLVSVQVLIVAIALLRASRNRTANRILAALLTIVVGIFTPYTIGFAGFYDNWPWLSFAPFSLPLLVGPLSYGYTHALATGKPPTKFAVHLTPGLVHLAYQTVCFGLPFTIKQAWDDRVHSPFIDPAISAATLLSIGVYSWFSLRLLRRYRDRLAAEVSDEARYAARWLRATFLAVVTVLAVWIAYQTWEVVFGRLSYFNSFGLYLVLAALALYLAAEGWRHAELRFPAMTEASHQAVLQNRVERSPPAGKDWAALGAQWAEIVRVQEWWRDPDLTLYTLAGRLGVNTSYLSRALNEGLGVNFASFINRYRAHAVAAEIDTGRGEDLLIVALEVGFNSKASFNRAFRATFGQSPSDYRSRRDANPKNRVLGLNLQREDL